MLDSLDTHYQIVLDAITDGRLVPFFGAGVNLCGRPRGEVWKHGRYLPSGVELAAHLAQSCSCPPSDLQDLARVSQYVAVMSGSGPLYDKLHEVFDADYPSTPVHDLFATLPTVLRDKGCDYPCQLIVTTNYDDVLERAFRAAGEPFDLVSYVAEGGQRGKFWHWLPNGDARLIEQPEDYRGLPLEMHGNKANVKRTVILKIHGAIDRINGDDSYVITEDHYIDYLTHTDISKLVPMTLAAKLKRSHFLFLGYSLRDWNLRVILHRIWGEQKLTFKSWAIQLNPPELDRKFWMKRDVEILDVCLEDYVAALGKRVKALPP